MKRRDFIKKSALISTATGLSAGALLGNSSSAAQAAAISGLSAGDPSFQPEFYSLRLFKLKPGAQRKRFDQFMQNAAIPALNRLGVKSVGVLSGLEPEKEADVYVLTRHKSLDDYATVLSGLKQDAQFVQDGAAFLNAPPSDPPYDRYETTLLQSISGVPVLEQPKGAAAGPDRIFQLRIYESPSKKANLKKIEMFNVGELEIFRRAGMDPVFFGESLVGTHQPNLTYMLVFENMDARKKNWGKFGSDPAWKKLSTTPGYTDPELISNITNYFLKPTSYSQL